MSKNLRRVAIGAAVLGGVAYGSALPMQRIRLREVRAVSFSDAGIARFKADDARFAAFDPFPGQGNLRDAGELLNQQVRWEGEIEAPVPAAWATLDQRRLFGRVSPPWDEDTARFTGIDVSLLGTLLQYDHWDIEATGPLAAFSKAHSGQFYRPFPDFMALRDLAGARMAQALAARELLPAFGEVKHLAMLLYSTETLVGGMVASALLSDERRALNRAVSQGWLGKDDWPTLSRDDSRALVEFLEARAAEFAIGGGRRVGDALAGTSDLGVCIGLREAGWHIGIVRSALENPLPGEVDVSDDLRFYGEALAASPCRLTETRALWAHPEWWESGREEAGVESGFASRFPLWREANGLLLASVAISNYTGTYAGP